MRILAIRGKNLTSLSQEFEIDFQKEPLASAGLYAITGPTGSGKSTLLDALCLALYDDTPRLLQANKEGSVPEAGGVMMGQKDPRNLLRRGAGSGYAEVDFVASDKKTYRARWSARRAHEKSDGKLQNSEISLTALPSEQILSDNKKTETLGKIEALIGLSFQQFTRAVLLAQNDFASFLKANDNERAQLLETLTGTNTFSRISMEAFERAKKEREHLDQIELQLQGRVPLSAEIRAEKETEQKELAQAQLAAKTQQAETEDHLRWFKALDNLHAEEAAARSKIAEAQNKKIAAENRLSYLKTLDDAQDSKALILDYQRLGKLVSQEEIDTRQAKHAQQESIDQVSKLEQQLKQATQQHQQAEALLKDAKPKLEEAKRLDGQLQALNPQFEQAQAQKLSADKKLAETQKRETNTETEIAKLKAELISTKTWLENHTSLSRLTESWAGQEKLFRQLKSLRADEQQISERLELIKNNLAERSPQLEAAQNKCHTQERDLQTSVSALEQIQEDLKQYDLEGITKQRNSLNANLNELLEAKQIWQNLSAHHAKLSTLNQQKESYEEETRHADRELSKKRQESTLLERDLKAAKGSLELARLRASESVAHLRAALTPESECPVCGSKEHPFALNSPQADAILSGLNQQVAELEKTKSAQAREIISLEERQLSAQRWLQNIQKETEAIRASRRSDEERWRQHPRIGQLADIAEAEVSAWLEDQEQQIQSEISNRSALEATAIKAHRQKDELQSRTNELRKAFQNAKSALDGLEKSQAQDQHAAESEARQLLSSQQKSAQTRDELDSVFATSDWHAAWQASPDTFVADLKKKVDQFQGQTDQAIKIENQIQSLSTALIELRAARQSASDDLAQASEHFNKVKTALEELKQKRQALFGEKSISEIEAEFEHKIQTQKTLLDQTASSLSEAKTSSAKLSETFKHITELLTTHQSELAQVQAKLEVWLKAFNASRPQASLDLHSLTELLGVDSSWISAERRALSQINEAVTAAEAVLKDCLSRIEQHKTQRKSEERREALQERLAEIAHELNNKTEQLTQVKAELLKDDENQRQSTQLQTKIEAQRQKTELWARMSDLIGSADGKKFRNFAQQITLEILLGYANRHLETLSRRYRLERLDSSLGLLVVDQDMGDETRSAASLSGGESFLVSLALALGLASLSSHRVQVESLFIDEGFGSLDTDSLLIAMDALDNLQAQGRKVGVISHVQEMNERIGTRIVIQRKPAGESSIEIV